MSTTMNNDDLLKIASRYYVASIHSKRTTSSDGIRAINECIADVPTLILEIRRLKEKSGEETPSGAF